MSDSFIWGIMDDQEIETLNSDLFSIHEMMTKAAQNSQDKDKAFSIGHTDDTDTTSTEMASLEEDCNRRLAFLGEFILPENPSFTLNMHPTVPLIEKNENEIKRRRSTRMRKNGAASGTNGIGSDNTVRVEQELNRYIQSPTDPVGKVSHLI
jgi:hypothetical protein